VKNNVYILHRSSSQNKGERALRIVVRYFRYSKKKRALETVRTILVGFRNCLPAAFSSPLDEKKSVGVALLAFRGFFRTASNTQLL